MPRLEHRLCTHLVAAMTFLLFSSQLVGLSALRLHPAGNSSFSTLDDSSFWLSDHGNFTFGFQALDGGEDHLLSIWHSQDPNKTAIWWVSLSASASPLKAGATLRFTSTGSLQLHSAPPNASLLWSSNTSSAYAGLEDTGNLVLFTSNKENILWQSFDDGRDSLMLAEVDASRVSNKPYLLQSRENALLYAAGRFHVATDEDLNVYLHGLDSLGQDFVYIYAHMNTSGGFQIGRDYGKQFTSTSGKENQRLTLDYDGNLRVYMWASNVSSWEQIWQFLDDKCMLGSPCGPFGICTETPAAATKGRGFNCTCPPGYRPRKTADVSQGCQAPISFNATCGGTGHTSNYRAVMEEFPFGDYYYNDLASQPHQSIDECKALCLNDCACMAASYRTDNTCFLKGNSSTGYLLNGFASEDNTLLIKVTADNVSREAIVQKQGRSHWAIGVGVAVPLVVLIIAAGLVAWLLGRRAKGSTGKYPACIPFWGRRYRRHEVEGPDEVGRLRFFRYEELLHATRNFSETLGEGGFGIVYKGWVKLSQEGTIGRAHQQPAYGDKREIAMAVKVLKVRKHGGANEDAELRTLGKIHHINLVSLLGYSIKRGRAGDDQERLLVYEYMENGSLDRFLSTDAKKQLTWGMRYSIAMGAARGIAYLHHECSPPILHCDIKPHNILLDASFTPKVADFGFARRFHGDSHISMSGIRGTRGYLAPEWLSTQEHHLTSKLDVFSFGVLVLELVRGFKAVDDRSVPLIDWAIQCISAGEVIVAELDEDERLHDSMDEEGSISVELEASEKLRVLKVGMWCIQLNPSMRPPMSRVVQMMEGTLSVENPPIPRSALYYGLTYSDIRESSPSVGTATTVDDISYSLVSAR